MRTTRTFRFVWLLAAMLVFLSGCDSGANDGDERVVAGVDLEELFAPVQSSEIQSVLDDWAQRDVSVQNLEIVATDTIDFNTTKRGIVNVVSHTVAGLKHYGAIVTPLTESTEELPVMIYNHEGDDGVNLDATLTFLTLGINRFVDQLIFVVPSFRGEALTVNGITYQSEGTIDPWNYDVDDALALLNVALETNPRASAEQIFAFGFSRGSGVALLMACREPAIDLVVNYFGPTDFFVPDVQQIFAEALDGELRDIPIIDFLNEEYILPLKNGNLSVNDVRTQIIRWSPVYFADRLPPVQIHHGELDMIVSIEHARSLADALQGLGRDATEIDLNVYPAAGHNPIQMLESFDRVVEFVTRLIPSIS